MGEQPSNFWADKHNKRLEPVRHERASWLSYLGEPLKRSVGLLRASLVSAYETDQILMTVFLNILKIALDCFRPTIFRGFV